MRRLISPVLIAAILGCASLVAPVSALHRDTAPSVTIPFELVTRHIVVKVSINNSRPLSFVLDTGANTAIVRLDKAKELGLSLQGQVNTGGAGAGVQTGAFVRDATWKLVGLENFSQPVTLALPLVELPPGMGHDVDGIIGGEFIRRFVVEIDYQTRALVLHDPDKFVYTGKGQAIPLELNASSHPVVTAEITAPGRAPLERQFLFDIGSSGALILHSPFVGEQDLLGTQTTTVPVIGAAGAGGKTVGRIGRVQSLRLGPYTLENPIAMFSGDRAGAFANPALAGNIGAQIASRFRLFIDYGRRRLILEPSPAFTDPFDRAFSGMALRASGPDFKIFRVHELMPASPATEAGIEAGDILLSVDGAPAERLTLSDVNEMLEKPRTYTLTFQRGDRTRKVELTPRRMI